MVPPPPKTPNDNDNPTLFQLLDLDPHDQTSLATLNTPLILSTLSTNPSSITTIYKFTYSQKKCLPLHQAIKLHAPLPLIDALSTNDAWIAQQRCSEVDLDLALLYKSPLKVVELLLQKRGSEACLEKNKFGYTPLHSACFYECKLDIVQALIHACPEVMQERDISGYTPLHSACRCRSPIEMVRLLVDTWEGATREKDGAGYLPLHVACQYNAPVDVVSLLCGVYGEATRVKTPHGGYTPLHLACRYRAPLKVILLLLDANLEATKVKNAFGKTPYDLALEYNARPEIQKLMSVTPILLEHGVSKFTNPNELLSFFMRVSWSGGVLLVLDKKPDVAKMIGLHTNVMGDFLCMVGRCCRLTALWEVILNEQDLLGGVC